MSTQQPITLLICALGGEGGGVLAEWLPAIARHAAGQGVTIVVSPLIALMQDQVGALQELGVAAAEEHQSLHRHALILMVCRGTAST